MVSMGVTNFTKQTMVRGAGEGSLEIVEFMLHLGASNYTETLEHVFNRNNVENRILIFEKLQPLIHTDIDYNKLLLNAIWSEEIELIDLVLRKGGSKITNYDLAIQRANYYSFRETTKYLESYKQMNSRDN